MYLDKKLLEREKIVGCVVAVDDTTFDMGIYPDRKFSEVIHTLAHEMVHHNQRGEFDKHQPTKPGYAQSNPHLRKMEEEAYLKGNILFRDWEDNYKYRGEK